MNRSYLAILLGTAVACTSACSSAPKPEPASALNQPARPMIMPTSSTTTLTQIHVDPAIMAACNLPTPHFDFDSAVVRSRTDDGLDALARCFTTGPMAGRNLTLVGHADPRGGTEYNFALGQRRAGDVEDYLQDHGVIESRIKTSSRGALDATGTDEAGWQADRRVDIGLGSSTR